MTLRKPVISQVAYCAVVDMSMFESQNASGKPSWGSDIAMDRGAYGPAAGSRVRSTQWLAGLASGIMADDGFLWCRLAMVWETGFLWLHMLPANSGARLACPTHGFLLSFSFSVDVFTPVAVTYGLSMPYLCR
eukprot:TRINITY_DN14637_c0_g1_i4.p3 TRINITY_DN14637_c0_g1~~TRINITY_DN14637_c0_g1_i4.p3  ORF type:complete len:133 (+),score=1.99 TRINITY_DN14637_c0_g1_i4:668-1066(+)